MRGKSLPGLVPLPGTGPCQSHPLCIGIQRSSRYISPVVNFRTITRFFLKRINSKKKKSACISGNQKAIPLQAASSRTEMFTVHVPYALSERPAQGFEARVLWKFYKSTAAQYFTRSLILIGIICICLLRQEIKGTCIPGTKKYCCVVGK